MGIERFELGLKKAWLECRFFPLPAEIGERIPESQEKAVNVVDPKCEVCDGTGWKPVEVAPGKERRVTRCDCRRIEFVRTA